MNTDILISGGGIAGSALAQQLSRHGRVTVLERAPAPRRGGQAVDLRGAARTVVARMGLADRVREVTLDQKGIAWVDGHGRVTARMPVDAFGGEGIVSEVEILRGDLAAVLLDACTGVEHRYDDTVTGLDEDADGVTVRFENAPPRRFGLVVGADGLHSPVRTLAFGSGGVRPLGCHTAWFTAPPAPDLDGWYLMHNAPGGLVASLRPGRLPGETKASLSIRSDGTGRRDPAAWVDEFAARFAGVGWKAAWLVDAMRHAPDLAVDAVAQVHLPRWSRGRVVLVGDAGYCPGPLTGLGTSLAVVGAHVLAGELAAAGGDHRVAFERYEQVLRPYVAQAQQLPPGGVNGYAPMSRAAIRRQALMMRAMTRWPMRPLLERQFAKGDAIALPDYPELVAAESVAAEPVAAALDGRAVIDSLPERWRQ